MRTLRLDTAPAEDSSGRLRRSVANRSESVYASALCYHENPRKKIEIFYRAVGRPTVRHDENSHRAMRTRRSVALLIETSNAYARGLLAGITDYVRQPRCALEFQRGILR